MNERPGSSGGKSVAPAEQSGAKAGGSNPPQGSGVWLYVLVRKEMTGGTLLAQVAHASSEAASEWSLARRNARSMGSLPLDAVDHLPADTRACILGATKEELAMALYDLGAAEVPHIAITETDGPLTGVVTAIGLVTVDRADLRAQVPMLSNLRPWRDPK